MREEQRIITALFADLEGSTVLGERLAEEEIKLLLGGAVFRFAGVVAKYGSDGTRTRISLPSGSDLREPRGDPVRHTLALALSLLAG